MKSTKQKQTDDNNGPHTGDSALAASQLLTRSQVAAELNVCNHTVARRTRSGELPCVIFSRRLIRYERATVRAFILAAQVHTKEDLLAERPLPVSLPPRRPTQGAIRSSTGNVTASSGSPTRGKGAAAPTVTGILAVQEDVQ